MNKIIQGDCLEKLKDLEENSVDSIVCDPPYELGFMGKSWDSTGIANNKEMWAECLRVLKPGGHLLAFSGTRTYHRMASAIEDAGFEVRDMIEWVYGCLSEDTEILTESGYRFFKDISKDEKICIYNKDNNSYSYERPEKWSSYKVENEDCYSIKSDDTDQIVSKNHRCLVERNGKLEFEFAENLREKEIVPLFEGNKVYNGDCLEVLAGIPDKSIDMVLTSPPYNMRTRIRNGKYTTREKSERFSKKYKYFDDALPIDEFYEFHKKCLSEMLRVSKIVIYNFQIVTGSKEAFFKIIGDFHGYIKDIIIWDKGFGQPAMHEKVLNSAYEMLLILENDKKAGRVINNSKFKRGELQNILRIGRGKKKSNIHLACFPEELAETIIKNFSNEGDIILDPMVGSGTTLKMAKKNNRNYIGIEIAEEYCDLIHERTQDKPNTTLATIEKIKYTGTIFCPTVSTGAFIARRNGQVFITGNSGFPKSLNIGKAVDKLQGNEREVVGEKLSPDGIPYSQRQPNDWEIAGFNGEVRPKNTLNTKGTSEWEGWGTALKPAHEPICMARKPLAEKTVAENCLKYGTGGINIDESRVEIPENDKENYEFNNNGLSRMSRPEGDKLGQFDGGWKIDKTKRETPQGRFPANLIHDGSDEVRECFPKVHGAGNKNKSNITSGKSMFGIGDKGARNPKIEGDNGGNAGRFFKSIEVGEICKHCLSENTKEYCYCDFCGKRSERMQRLVDSVEGKSIIYQAKASKSERNRGCEELYILKDNIPTEDIDEIKHLLSI